MSPTPASPGTPSSGAPRPGGAVKIVLPGTTRTPQAEMSLALASLPHPEEFGHGLPWFKAGPRREA